MLLQVSLPLYEPSTLLLLTTFARKNLRPVGHLRVRLSTVLPGRVCTGKLPLLGDRKAGGEMVGRAHMTLQVRDKKTRKTKE